MTHPRRLGLACAVLGLVSLSFGLGFGAARAQDGAEPGVVGTWQVRGWNPDVDPGSRDPNYQGTVTIEDAGNHTFRVNWRTPEDSPGIGIYDERSGVFAVAYVLQGRPGVALYRPTLEGEQMEGRWTVDRAVGHAGSENWRRSE